MTLQETILGAIGIDKGSRKKRVFIVKANQAYVDSSMNINALSSYGRLDVVARSAIAALIDRAGVRKDTVFYAVLEGRSKPFVLELDGENLGTRFESEAEFGILVRQVVCGTPTRGVVVYNFTFEDLVLSLLKAYGKENVYYLHELGLDVSMLRLKEGSAFILGDHKGIDAQTERWLKSQGITWLSLGSTPYFTESCITFIHAVLDGFISP
ncbi:MAG: hypothetical protein QW512_03845 [Thermofilaceae archaeon]